MPLPGDPLPTSIVPGRQRWEMPGLRGNPVLGRLLERALPAAEGVEHVRANPVTGRVLVRHDPALEPVLVARTVRRVMRRVAEALTAAPRPLTPGLPGADVRSRVLTAPSETGRSRGLLAIGAGIALLARYSTSCLPLLAHPL